MENLFFISERSDAMLSCKMAKTSVIARSQKKPKFKSRVVRRCFRCGRKRGYMRDFDLCRICFREFANEGAIPGIKKSSW
jgi:small subunit ribosomal protein S14